MQSTIAISQSTTAAADATRAWYVVHTQRRREAVAASFLSHAGLITYCPRTVEWPRPVVGSAIVPMFPGYLFVHAAWPLQHYTIMRSIGVKSLLFIDGCPASVDAAALDFLRGREDPDGIIRSGQAAAAEIEILKGPFRGLTALVQERLPARERVRVLLQLFQRQVSVEIPERAVRRA